MQARIIDYSAFIRALVDPCIDFRLVASSRVIQEKDWQVGPRILQDHIIYYIESGGTAGHVNGGKVVMEPHDFFWMQPQVNACLRMMPNISKTGIIFNRIHLTSNNRPLRIRQDYILCPGNEAFRINLLHLQQYLQKPLSARCTIGAVISNVFFGQNRDIQKKPGLKSHQCKRALSFIRNNIKCRFNIAELANYVRLNPTYFARQFRKNFGISPQAYIKKERINYAKTILLESNFTVSEVALHLGYENCYFFSKQFKEITGTSPAHWRESQ